VNVTLPKRGARASAFVFACALAACAADRVDLSPRANRSAPAAIFYTAIGASDAVGYNASVPCANPPSVAVPTCPGGTGYVPDLAKQLRGGGASVTLNDLGISSAVIGPDIAATGNLYGSQGSAAPCLPRTGSDVIPGDFLTNELPKLSGSETLVTIFAGGNDTNAIVNANAAACLQRSGAAGPAVQQFLATEIQAFGADFTTLVQGVRAKAPGARIVVANLPNFAGIPFAQSASVAPAKPLLQAVSVGIDTNVYQPAATRLGIPVVDLLCDPQSYATASFFPGPLADGFHPNDAGYAALAASFFAQIGAATPVLPQTTCSQMSVASAALAPQIPPLPNPGQR